MAGTYVSLPLKGSPNWKSPVQTVADLPALGNSIGDARVVIDDNTPYIWNGTSWNAVSGGGASDSFTTIQTPQGTFPVATSPVDVLTYTSDDGSIVITGDETTDTIDIELARNITYVVEPNNNGGGQSLLNTNISIRPLQDSASEQWNFLNRFIDIDPDSSGFDIGTGGQSFSVFNTGIQHLGTSNVGEIRYFNSGINLGNGTDPIDVKGITFSATTGNINDNVTISATIQGYGFNIQASAASIINSNVITPFLDNAVFNSDINSYSSFAAGPVINAIRASNNYTGFNCTPNIGTIDPSSIFSGINIAPTISSSTNPIGISVSMNNVTGTNVRALSTSDGIVNFNAGDVSVSNGNFSCEKISAFKSITISDGGGNPQTIHGIISQILAPNGVTTANCDTLGLNTAALIGLDDNSISTSGPIGLGIVALGLPAVVVANTGSTLDNLSGAAFAVNFDVSSTGGTIDTVNICRSLAIPNGITTVNKLRGYHYGEPFGPIGTVRWGFYNEADVDNFFKASLKIGGVVGSTDTVTNTSVALEIESTTRAFLNARMDTTARDALTAINGMQIYNIDTDKFQGYAGGTWVDLN